MSEPSQGPVLDYASPLARGPLRLADRSILTFIPVSNGVNIVESLEGRGRAVAAIIFSSCAVILLGPVVFGEAFDHDISIAGVLLYLGYAVMTVIVILAVINANWRTTILGVTREHLILDFKTPFRLARRQWNPEELKTVNVVQQLDPRTKRIAHEIQLEFYSHPLTRLFTGHDPPELHHIVDTVRQHFAPATT